MKQLLIDALVNVELTDAQIHWCRQRFTGRDKDEIRKKVDTLEKATWMNKYMLEYRMKETIEH